MPTLHTGSRKWLERNGLHIPWCIRADAAKRAGSLGCHLRVAEGSARPNAINFSGRRTPPCGLSDLKRRSDEVIWVREGKTEHPAYELENGTALEYAGDDNNMMMWVEWASNGERVCVSRLQMVCGLGARKRQRPNYLSYKDLAPAAPAAKPEHAVSDRTMAAGTTAGAAAGRLVDPAASGKKNKDRGKNKTFSDRPEDLRTHGHGVSPHQSDHFLPHFNDKKVKKKRKRTNENKSWTKSDEGRRRLHHIVDCWDELRRRRVRVARAAFAQQHGIDVRTLSPFIHDDVSKRKPIHSIGQRKLISDVEIVQFSERMVEQFPDLRAADAIVELMHTFDLDYQQARNQYSRRVKKGCDEVLAKRQQAEER